jgi:hypothetical protein
VPGKDALFSGGPNHSYVYPAKGVAVLDVAVDGRQHRYLRTPERLGDLTIYRYAGLADRPLAIATKRGATKRGATKRSSAKRGAAKRGATK